MRPLTDKQKSRLWEQTRNTNFQASRRLEGVTVPLVTLTAEEALRRVRLIDAQYVQSEAQEALLYEFENALLQKMA